MLFSRPYIYDMLHLGAQFWIVPSDASELKGAILFGFGMMQLPLADGTRGFPPAFLKEAAHHSWVEGG